MCLDRIADLGFFWKPLPNECCQSASSSGFAMPTTRMMLEILYKQFGNDATLIWPWVIHGICLCWKVICIYIVANELLSISHHDLHTSLLTLFLGIILIMDCSWK